VSTSERQQIIAAIDEAVENGARQWRACEVLGLCERRLRRWRIRPEDARKGGYRAHGQKLTAYETMSIVAEVEREDRIHLPLKVIHTQTLDEGKYLASYATFVRVMTAWYATQAIYVPPANVTRLRPELTATAPNQIWCWDITWLPFRVRGRYFFLYMIIDMYSRKIVGWAVHTVEDGRFARELFNRAFASEGVQAGQIIVHADNGKPMRSQTLQAMFELRGIQASHGRPHTSNDNAFAESLFATLKGRVLYPENFESLAAAESFAGQFVTWYNEEHLHSALDFVSPNDVHTGRHLEIFARRNALLEEHRNSFPQRYGTRKKVYGIEETVTLKHRVSLKTENAL
jgi:putative transposase